MNFSITLNGQQPLQPRIYIENESQAILDRLNISKTVSYKMMGNALNRIIIQNYSMQYKKWQKGGFESWCFGNFRFRETPRYFIDGDGNYVIMTDTYGGRPAVKTFMQISQLCKKSTITIEIIKYPKKKPDTKIKLPNGNYLYRGVVVLMRLGSCFTANHPENNRLTGCMQQTIDKLLETPIKLSKIVKEVCEH